MTLPYPMVADIRVDPYFTMAFGTTAATAS